MRYFDKKLASVLVGMAIVAGSATALAQGPVPAPTIESSDHDAVVGRLAVGYLGASQVAVGAENGATVLAPVVGVRYWLDEMLGLDLGLGLGMTSGETKTSVPNSPTLTEKDPSFTAFLIHAGVPLSLAQGKHYSFQVVPELNLGFGTGKQEPVDVANPKIEHSGMRFDIGARAGAEIHFGFMGLPELSLQGTVGLQFVTASTKTEAKLPGATAKVEAKSTRIGTTVHDNPWNIFTSNVAALYYF